MAAGNRSRASQLTDGAAARRPIAPIDGSRMRVQYARIGECALKRSGTRLVDGLIGNSRYYGGQIDYRDRGRIGHHASGRVGNRKRDRVGAVLEEFEGRVGSAGRAAIGERPQIAKDRRFRVARSRAIKGSQGAFIDDLIAAGIG
jgi:hypothetical protein